MTKYVYSFNEGSKDMRHILGGKGANLAEMTKIGLPVPFGFTVSTAACNKYYEEGEIIDPAIIEEIREKMVELQSVTEKQFGDANNPLLVSVRSGSVVSMPGMMDTILNLGLNDVTTKGLAKLTSNEVFALDSYRRFIQMFANVVCEIPMELFSDALDAAKERANVEHDIDLSAKDLNELIVVYKDIFKREKGIDFPQDPQEQLMQAIMAVFRSWNNERAILYRKLNKIPDDYGTAVNVQSMVFGNMGSTSGTGVAFTRSPVTGEKKIFGEFLVNAQGEDVVAGIRTPQNIHIMGESFPEVFKQFSRIANVLETHYKNMQDMEFTVEKGKLYMLQTRDGKRTAESAIKIAVDMVEEGLIDKETALMRIMPEQIDQLLHPKFSDKAIKETNPIAKGLAASPGAASGHIYFSADDAQKAAATGKKVILVRKETSPEDLAGMVAAVGILTARGGMTSHAAVVARGMGKCCVAGCSELEVLHEEKAFIVNGKKYVEDDYISIDGATGYIYEGNIPTVSPELSGNFAKFMEYADGFRKLNIRANADTPVDALHAVGFGAEGIGLCRTEHMFFEDNRIPAIRQMIMSNTLEERKAALDLLLPFQRDDFIGIFSAMEERPVTIRLLDPPLHEFLPKNEEQMQILAQKMNLDVAKLHKKADELLEMNPMLGHRGCRLAITYPEIARMQTRAIIEAAIHVKKEKGYDIRPEIMIPLIGIEGEIKFVKDIITSCAKEIMEELVMKIDYTVGTMIEIPRAAIIADKIATHAEFFSFGTNDLTQLTYGFSRDDTGEIIKEYLQKGILKEDVFQTIDVEGVGELVKMAVKKGRQTRSNIKLGICGEHGGDPKSIEFCNSIGLNYVSCSPFRVPIARLAAAQAVIKSKK